MKTYCVICHANSQDGSFNRNTVGIYNEIKQPVCKEHAKYCIEEGHGYTPLTPPFRVTL